MNTVQHIETAYVRVDGDDFTVAPTRGQFYGSAAKAPTVSDREWAAMVRDTIAIERRILKAMNVVLTPDIYVGRNPSNET